MAASASNSEIVEVGDELDLLHNFSRANLLRIKLRATECKSTDDFDHRGLPRVLGPSHEMDRSSLRNDKAKNPVRVGVSRELGIGNSESPSLKQALRRLCISQASEMAAIKRSSKLMGSSSVADVGTIEWLYASVVAEKSKPGNTTKNSTEKATQAGKARNAKSSKSTVASLHAAVSALKSAKIRRAQDLIAAENRGRGSENSNASKNAVSPHVTKPGIQNDACSKRKGKQGKQEAVGTTDTPSIFNKFIKAPSPTSSKKNPGDVVGTKNNSNHASKADISSNGCNFGGNFSIKVNGGRDKGGCSQSSQSSLGDCSTSTGISEESNYYGSSSNCHRPHMSKDVRWAAIHHVVKEQGSLGLKNFKLLRRLGCGDIGTVYLAELLGSGYLFALKVMDIEFLVSRKKMLRAQTERDILQMLDHPFLPTLYAHFTIDNLSFLVMEYCTGGDLHVLRQMQHSRCFNEPTARFYVAEILLALEYLHMLGVIYRDLKPENILVRDDGHIMLSDFDLSMRCAVSPTLLTFSSIGTKERLNKISGPCTNASCMEPFCFTPRLLSSPAILKERKINADAVQASRLPQLVVEPTDARSNSFVGTHEYLAPEIIRGDGHGSSVDWWTLGIFLYELLFGRTPFRGSGNEDTLANVVTQGLKFPESPDVDFYAKDLIRGLLIKEPESRLGSARGAAEIKPHPFFEGLNWALIRCAAPPEVPGLYGAQIAQIAQKEEGKHLDFNQF